MLSIPTDQGKHQVKASTKQVKSHTQLCMTSQVLALTSLSVLFSGQLGHHGEHLDQETGPEVDVTRTEHHNLGSPCAFLRLAATKSHCHMMTSCSLQRAATMTCNWDWERGMLCMLVP